TWTAGSTDELGFSVERSLGAQGTFSEVARTGPGITSFVDVGLSDATTYCYRLRAFNETDYSDYSNTACGTTPQQYGLAVLRTGTGTGTVTRAPGGITSGATCSASYPRGASVSLLASPASGSVFSGWSGGGCSGTATCIVAVTAITTVTASFVLQPITFTVSKAGSGSGTITST